MGRTRKLETAPGTMFETLETPQSNRAEPAFLIDLRRHPRFETNFPGETFAESGQHLSVRITNVSVSGLRLEGSRQTVDALLAKFDRHTLDSDRHTSLEVHFSVPTDSNNLVPVKAHCRIVYTRHAGEDIYQIGMNFVTFEEGRAALAEYLRDRLATR